MKKIGIIVALALIVTIAGTYATWSYTTGATNVDSKDLTGISIAITDKEIQTADGGTITVTKSDNLKIEVDDDGSHNAKLVFTGSITVTYTNSSADVNGLVLNCTSTAPSNSYKGSPIFIAGSLNSVREIGANESGAYAKWVIEGDDLAQLFKLNGTVTAATVNDYDTLKTALEGATYSITVSAAG